MKNIIVKNIARCNDNRNKTHVYIHSLLIINSPVSLPAAEPMNNHDSGLMKVLA